MNRFALTVVIFLCGAAVASLPRAFADTAPTLTIKCAPPPLMEKIWPDWEEPGENDA